VFETWTQIPYSPAMKPFEVKQPRHLHCWSTKFHS
jgi:hypothetical protein